MRLESGYEGLYLESYHHYCKDYNYLKVLSHEAGIVAHLWRVPELPSVDKKPDDVQKLAEGK